jgi:hypothetical protein
MVDKCILKDTKIFEFFSMHLDVFIVYFIVFVVFQCFSMYIIKIYKNVFECIYSVLKKIDVYLWCILMYL